MGNKIDETFGQRVARLRTTADLTQDKLAAKAGLPVTSLRNYEHDHRRPRADAALRLARALGVTVEGSRSWRYDERFPKDFCTRSSSGCRWGAAFVFQPTT